MSIALKTVTDEKYFAIADEYNGRIYLYVNIGGSITVCKIAEDLKVGDSYYGKIQFCRGTNKMVEYDYLDHVPVRKNGKRGEHATEQSIYKANDDYLVKAKRRMVLEGIEPGSSEWEKGKDDAATLFAAVNNCEKHVSKDTYIWKQLYDQLFKKNN